MSWELLAAQGTGDKSGGKGSFFGSHETQYGGGQGDKSCNECGETGHDKRDCPKKGSKSGGAANRRDP